jgi:acyl-CoA thioester hydrolase
MESGAGIIVSRLEIRYLRPLRLEERLVVRTKINNIAPASAVLEQVFDRDGQTAAELVVELVFLGPNGKPARWPDSLLRALQQKEAE